MAAPMLAEALFGGKGTFGGELGLAFVTAVAFATILAVVAASPSARRPVSRTTSTTAS
ncbi:hypothetical protein [Deinococcus cavernae]|uniref:hypothetical protein n=1 Tax=Deinococcus cavernae TaxID=2320857 RepID=UPI001F30A5A8|nr:hypothetical protein [Deinococcus cavernae]